MKSAAEIRKIIAEMNEELFNALNDAWYDDEKLFRKLLRKVGLTVEEYEAWDSDVLDDEDDECFNYEDEDEDEDEVIITLDMDEVRKVLRREYLDILAYFATILAEYDEMVMESALDIIDEQVWTIAQEMDETDMWLRVSSGLRCGC